MKSFGSADPAAYILIVLYLIWYLIAIVQVVLGYGTAYRAAKENGDNGVSLFGWLIVYGLAALIPGLGIYLWLKSKPEEPQDALPKQQTRTDPGYAAGEAPDSQPNMQKPVSQGVDEFEEDIARAKANYYAAVEEALAASEELENASPEDKADALARTKEALEFAKRAAAVVEAITAFQESMPSKDE